MPKRESQFAVANRAVLDAAAKIERAMGDLLAATRPLGGVANTYVIERLAGELITRNPETLDWLNRQPGVAPMRLANALMDWRDMWASR